MEKLKIIILMLLLSAASYGQTAKQVLDKTAAGRHQQNTSEVPSHLLAQGSKGGKSEHLRRHCREGAGSFTSPRRQASVWFDGKTQWTYVKGNDEVNVSNPTESELASINPYHFIYMYQNGYTGTVQKKGSSYEVHLTATGKKSHQELTSRLTGRPAHPEQISFVSRKRLDLPSTSGSSRQPISAMPTSASTRRTSPRRR